MPKKQTKKKAKSKGKYRNAREFLEELVGPLTFGNMINSIRLCDEPSLETFAAKLGISPSLLLEVEKGQQCVSASRAAAWARILGYSETQFVRLALQAQLDEAQLDERWTVELKKRAVDLKKTV